MIVDPVDEHGYSRKDGRTIWPSTGNLGPAGQSVYSPSTQRRVDTGERTAGVSSTRATSTADVPGTYHVVCEQVGVPRRLVAH